MDFFKFQKHFYAQGYFETEPERVSDPFWGSTSSESRKGSLTRTGSVSRLHALERYLDCGKDCRPNMSDLGLLLPAPTESSVKRDDTLVLARSDLRQSQFSSKQRTLVIEHFEKRRDAAAITQVRDAYSLL